MNSAGDEPFLPDVVTGKAHREHGTNDGDHFQQVLDDLHASLFSEFLLACFCHLPTNPSFDNLSPAVHESITTKSPVPMSDVQRR